MINDSPDNNNFINITEEKISETLCLSSLLRDISRVADNSKPKLTKILKYIIIDNEKLSSPKFSTPKTLTK
jgi:hypothetical protein